MRKSDQKANTQALWFDFRFFMFNFYAQSRS
jgi:hypothetical protein